MSSFHATHNSSVSTGFTEQIMPILRILCYNGSLVTWTVVSLTTAKLKPLIRVFSMFGFNLSYTGEHIHFHDFVWLQLVVCTILLYVRLHTEGLKLCANRGPLSTLENFQWCAEPCFACAAILIGRCLPLIPKRDKRKSLLIWSDQCLMECYFNVGT
jgi:hypothetical protein